MHVRVNDTEHFFIKLFLMKLFEEDEIEVPVTKESAEENSKMETDETPAEVAAPPPSSNDSDVNMQDAKAAADTNGAVNGVPETGDKPVQMDTDAKVDTDKYIIAFFFLTCVSSFLYGFNCCHSHCGMRVSITVQLICHLMSSLFPVF